MWKAELSGSTFELRGKAAILMASSLDHWEKEYIRGPLVLLVL